MIAEKRKTFYGWKSALAVRIVSRVLFLSLLWWILTEKGFPLSLLGIVGVASGATLSFYLAPSPVWNWKVLPWLRFFLFFSWQSFLGGMDVAQRALRAGPAVQPMVVRYLLGVRGEESRVFFLLVVSLLPGTAAVDLRDGVALIHVLDKSLLREDLLKDLENRIAPLFVP